MTEEEIKLLREIYPAVDPEAETFWQNIGRQLHAYFVIRDLCGYNPQLLLTDQRSPEKKLADAMVASYREAFPDLLKTFTENSPLGEVFEGKMFKPSEAERWANCGTVTGRYSGGYEPMPWTLPRGEEVVPILPPGDEIKMAPVDYGQTEARVIRAGKFRPSFTVMLDARTERFTATMAQMQRQMRAMQEEVMFRAIYGPTVFIDIDLPNGRERFIARLMASTDPRRRKRGRRLFNRWVATRPGINYYRKD